MLLFCTFGVLVIQLALIGSEYNARIQLFVIQLGSWPCSTEARPRSDCPLSAARLRIAPAWFCNISARRKLQFAHYVVLLGLDLAGYTWRYPGEGCLRLAR